MGRSRRDGGREVLPSVEAARDTSEYRRDVKLLADDPRDIRTEKTHQDFRQRVAGSAGGPNEDPSHREADKYPDSSIDEESDDRLAHAECADQ